MIDPHEDKGLSAADFVAGSQGSVMKKTPEVKEETETVPLFVADEAQRFRSEWEKIQSEFVDEPRKSVKDADGLVARAMQRLAEIFAEERAKLEHEWDRGDQVST